MAMTETKIKINDSITLTIEETLNNMSMDELTTKDLVLIVLSLQDQITSINKTLEKI